ncbi:hypothetical protein McanMca71_002296 [Microsporum canis]
MANPIEGTIATSSMIYTGPIAPGGKNMTLEGTAEQIYYQILKLNPTYRPEDFLTPATNTRFKLEGRGRRHIKGMARQNSRGHLLPKTCPPIRTLQGSRKSIL